MAASTRRRWKALKLPARLQWHTRGFREQIIAALAAAVVIGAVGFYLHHMQLATLRNLSSRVTEMEHEIRGLHAELSLRQNEITQAGVRQGAAEAHASPTAQTREFLSQRGRFSSLIDELIRLANEDDIQIISIKPGVPQEYDGYVELPMTIEVRARFRRLGEYLHQVQHLQQVVLVGRIHAQLLAVEQAALTVQMETVSFMGRA
jgi:Tfp pilus assembly protein PilO